MEDSIKRLDLQTSALRTDLGILNTRQNFTKSFVDNLNTAAADLTNADLRVEAADELSLSSQQSFAIKAISLASQSAQLILRLFS